MISIIESAAKLFAAKGFNAVTTKEIATKAKVNEVTIFRQFKSKDNLFEEVMKYISSKPNIDEYINQNEELLEDYLLGIGNLLYTFFIQNFDLLKIELTDRYKVNEMQHISDFINDIQKRFSDYLVYTKQYSKDDAENYSICFMTAVHGICMNIYLIETFDSEPKFEKLLNYLVQTFK